MYQQLYTLITTQLTALGFVNVASALGHSPALPALAAWRASKATACSAVSTRT